MIDYCHHTFFNNINLRGRPRLNTECMWIHWTEHTKLLTDDRQTKSGRESKVNFFCSTWLTPDTNTEKSVSVCVCVCGCVSANITRADHYRIKKNNVWKAAPLSCGETSLSSVTRRDIQRLKRQWRLLTHFDWNKYTVYIFWVANSRPGWTKPQKLYK